jgi:hypothetical protein
MKRAFTFFVLLVIGIMLWGCSRANQTPMTPINTQDDEFLNINSNDEFPDLPFQGRIGILGSYELNLNPGEMTAELVFNRTNSLGESYLVSGMSYFTINPCVDCLRLEGFQLTEEGYLEIIFSIRHPFKPGSVALPPSSTNRRDLDVFDTAMVIVPRNIDPSVYPLLGCQVFDSVCVNNDGYTRELSELTGNSVACPFFLVVDDTDAGVKTYNRFAMGTQKTFSTYFDLSGSVSFDLYLTMGYGNSAKKLTRLNPTYFNPEFNRKNAWKVEVIPPQGDNPPFSGNTWNNEDNSSEYNVTVRIWDWQIGANVVNPPSAVSDIAYASDVSLVSVEIPGMTGMPKTSATPQDGAGNTPVDPLVFVIPVANENLLPIGEYQGIVRVMDERNPPVQGAPGKVDMLIDSPDGIQTNWYTMQEFATYQAFTATVVQYICEVSGSLISPSGDSYDTYSGDTIEFQLDVDPVGGTVLYWADWGTGTYTESGTSPIMSHRFTDSECPPSANDTYVVNFGVEMSCDPGNIVFIDSFTVNLTSCLPLPPPVGNVNLVVNRNSTANYQFNANAPWTLSWTNPGGSTYDFAIYWDNDPTDGLMNDLELAGTTTGISWSAPASHMDVDGTHYVKGITYVVYSRNMGQYKALSPSEPAHIIIAGAETASTVVTYDIEGWTTNNQNGNNTEYYHLPHVTHDYTAHGTWSVRIGNLIGQMSHKGEWEGFCRETPSIPSASTRFLSFSMYRKKNG